MAITYTEDKCTGGTSSGTVGTSGHDHTYAFDNNASTYWNTDASGAFPHYLQYDFGAGVAWKISRVTIKNYLAKGIINFSIMGSNNDTNWTTLYTGTATDTTDVQTFTFTNKTKYRYCKFNITSNVTGTNTVAYEVEMMAGIYPPVGGLGIGNPYIF